MSLSRMKRVCWLVVLLGLWNTSTISASDSKNFLIVTGGINNHQMRDEMFSPLKYGTTRSLSGFQYLRIDQNTRQAFNLEFTKGKIETHYNYLSSDNIVGNLSYEFSKKILTPAIQLRNLDIYIGGMYELYADFILYETDDYNAAWFTANSIGPSVASRYGISNKQSIFIQTFSPLLSYVVRPPYAGFNEEVSEWVGHDEKNIAGTDSYQIFAKVALKNGEMVSLKDYRSFSLRTIYLYQMYNSIHLGLEYQLRLSVIENPRYSKIVNQNILLGLALKF